MFLSFIIPVYNAAPYLEACLESLFQQDLPAEAFEVLAVDDGSSDGSEAILARCQEAHPNVRLFSQNHLGVSAARNLGLRNALGDYVWFVDAYDLIQEKVLGLFRRCVAAESPDRLIFEVYAFYQQLGPEEAAAKAAGTLASNTGVSAVSACASLFRRRFLLEHALSFDEALAMSEDAMFLYEFQLHEPVVTRLPQTAYYWRRNQNSTTLGVSKSSIPRKMESQLRFVTRMDRYYRERKGDLSVCADYLMSNLWGYLYYASGLDRKAAREAIRALRARKLFPYRRPPECTLKKTYMTTRTDLLGKLFEWIGMHLHRPWGYGAMRLFRLCKRS